jgi:hypothetical protein
MPIPHSPYAPTNPFAPEPVGICDRCCFLWPLAKLAWQHQWAGLRVVNQNLRVCPHCIDELQENGFRTIHIGPDPTPIEDPRPTRYVTQSGVPPGNFILDDPGEGLLDDGKNVL